MAGIKIKSLNQFLDNNINAYQVPVYQRKYTWDKFDCEKFLNDIYNWYRKIQTIEVNVDQDNYFAGSIITFTDKKNMSSIVDGQQRLTTTLLILCALKYHLVNENKNYDNVEKMIFSKSRELDSIAQKKLKLNNPKNDEVLLKISNLTVDFNSDNLLILNFKHLIGVIEKIKHDNPNYDEDILESLKFTIMSHVILNENDNPTEIFETINTTGKKLTAADMIKNYLFFFSYKFLEKENILSKKYDEIEDLLFVSEKKEKHDLDMMTFYRYFNNIVSGVDLAKKESIIIFTQFKEIYSYDKVANFESVNNIIDIIKKHAWIWNKIHKYEPKRKIDKFYYNSFKDTIYTYYSLVHQLIAEKVFINSYGEFDIDENYLRNIFRIISKLMFSLLISGKSEKNITRDIPNIYKLFKESNFNDFEKWMIERSKNNEGIIILDKEGIEKYINNTNVYLLSSKKTKFLLYGIEGMLDNWEIEIKKIDDLSVEHISPQNPNKNSSYFKYALHLANNNELEAEEYLERIKHKLPNLTLVACETNSELSNKSYKEKFMIYNERSFLSINKELSKYEEWNEESIKKRSSWLVEQIDNLLNISN